MQNLPITNLYHQISIAQQQDGSPRIGVHPRTPRILDAGLPQHCTGQTGPGNRGRGR